MPRLTRVEHLVGGGEPGLLGHADVELADGDDALVEVGLLLRIRLVHHALVAVAGGAGLVGVDSGDEDEPVLHLFLYLCQTVHIITDRVLAVRGAGPHDHQELVAVSRKYVADLLVSLCFQCRQLRGQRELLLDLVRGRQDAYILKSHIFFLLYVNINGIFI